MCNKRNSMKAYLSDRDIYLRLDKCIARFIEHLNINGVRRLTPTECERLQGFPDGWTEGVSDTQRYTQCGNAVTVNVVEYILRYFPSNKRLSEVEKPLTQFVE